MRPALAAQVAGLMAGASGRAAWRRARHGPLRPSWSWKTELLATSMRALMMGSNTRGIPWLREAILAVPYLSPYSKQVRTEAVDAGGVPARWFVPLGAAPPERVLVYYHGGGFVIGAIDTHADLMARLAVLAKARVLGVEYRLAPEHRFPAAHDDALTAARFALASCAPAQVALAGDSAGGNLAIATLCSLRDAGDPLPAAAALLCPWTDPLAAGGSIERNAEADFADRALLVDWYEQYAPPGSPRDPRAFVCDQKLEGLPPLLVQVGGAEILHDQIVAFADRARAAGVAVELEVARDMFHDWQLQAHLLPEGVAAVEQIARFVAGKTGSA